MSGWQTAVLHLFVPGSFYARQKTDSLDCTVGCASFSPHPWLHTEMRSSQCPWAAEGQPDPPWASPGPQGTAALLLEHLLPPSVLTLGATGLLLSNFSPPSPSCSCIALFLSLQSAVKEAHPASWLSSAQQWVSFGAAGAALLWHGAVLDSAHKVHSWSSHATKTLPHKPNTVSNSVIPDTDKESQHSVTNTNQSIIGYLSTAHTPST